VERGDGYEKKKDSGVSILLFLDRGKEEKRESQKKNRGGGRGEEKKRTRGFLFQGRGEKDKGQETSSASPPKKRKSVKISLLPKGRVERLERLRTWKREVFTASSFPVEKDTRERD